MNVQNNSLATQTPRKVFLYGCGVIAPQSANLQEFLENVWKQEPLLSSESVLNNAFLVGKPKFSFENYREWILERHPPTRFSQLCEKGGENVHLAIGAVIEALRTSPQLESALKTLDPRVGICLGSGLGDLPVIFQSGKDFDRALRSWNHFWASPERNPLCAAWLRGDYQADDVPQDPRQLPVDSWERFDAWAKWDAYWANKNPQMAQYIEEFIRIEQMGLGEDVSNDKLKVIRLKAKAQKELQARYGNPPPPWEMVSPNLLWNLPNGAAAQVSMTLGIHGPTYNANGACATFGLVLQQGYDLIQKGECDVVIVGTVDNTPPPEVVSAFYSARVLATGPEVGKPLCQMRGTHVAGGACIWIIGTPEVLEGFGIKHMGVELLASEISADAEHIITPSPQGPKLAIRKAFAKANISVQDITCWDMHATGTPGDWNEMQLIEDFVPAHAVISARKGIFGHGMASNGGWELTALALGLKRTQEGFVVPPSGIPEDEIHASIRSMKRRIAAHTPVPLQNGNQPIICGKLSMGVGGITSCTLVRVYP